MSELKIKQIPTVTSRVDFDEDEITEAYSFDEVTLIFISINKGYPQIAGSVFGDTVFWLDSEKDFTFNIAGKTASDIILEGHLESKPQLFHDEFVLPLIRALDDALSYVDLSLSYERGDTMENAWNGEIIHHDNYRNYEISLTPKTS